MRRGATLLELALCLVVLGLLLAISLPRLQEAADRLAVHQAALDLVSAHRRARIGAILQSRVLELTIDSMALVIRQRGSTREVWRAPGPAATHVSLPGPPRTMSFSPVGITLGLSNASFSLSRGAATRTVIVSRLGRVRTVP